MWEWLEWLWRIGQNIHLPNTDNEILPRKWKCSRQPSNDSEPSGIRYIWKMNFGRNR